MDSQNDKDLMWIARAGLRARALLRKRRAPAAAGHEAKRTRFCWVLWHLGRQVVVRWCDSIQKDLLFE